MNKKVVLSAVQPTNQIHLGNWLGAIKNWVGYQNDYDCLFFAVDLHSITVKQDPKELRENTYRAIATYIACGIDPNKATLFVQSQVPQHAELAWALTCHSSMGELSRMTQYKDKSQKHGTHIPTGLFTYPVLMAADILLYNTHLVIMSLQDGTAKMSKSDPIAGSCVFLTDSDKEIEKKFKRAVTDSGTEVSAEDQQPGIRNLLQIQASILGEDYQTVLGRYVGKQYGYLKVDTANVAINAIRPIREKTEEILKDRGELDRILKAGCEAARARASKQLAEVYQRLGFITT